MSETKKCPYCDKEIKKEAIKCKYCGMSLPFRKCDFCLEVIDNDAKVCPHCGSNLESIETNTVSGKKKNNVLYSIFNFFDCLWFIFGLGGLCTILTFKIYNGVFWYILDTLLSIIFLAIFLPSTRIYIEKKLKIKINFSVKFFAVVLYMIIVGISTIK